MNYWFFLVRFVLWSAAFFAVWHLLVANWYVGLMSVAGPVVTMATTGFTAEIEGAGRAARVFFSPAGQRIGIHIATLTDGLLPFLALVAATSTRSILDRIKLGALGIGMFALFHLAMFAAYPFFLSHSGSSLIVDSLGAFWAILSLAGLPFLLWLVLLQVGLSSPATPPPAGDS